LALFFFDLVISVASTQTNMNYEHLLFGAALQRVKMEGNVWWEKVSSVLWLKVGACIVKSQGRFLPVACFQLL